MSETNTYTSIQISDVVKGWDFDNIFVEPTPNGGLSLESTVNIFSEMFKNFGFDFKKEEDVIAGKTKAIAFTVENFFPESNIKFIVSVGALGGTDEVKDCLGHIGYGFAYDMTFIKSLIADKCDKEDAGEVTDTSKHSRSGFYLFSLLDYLDKFKGKGEYYETGKGKLIAAAMGCGVVITSIFVTLRKLAVIDLQNQVLGLVKRLDGGIDPMNPEKMPEILEASFSSIDERVKEVLGVVPDMACDKEECNEASE